jgi:hypothetical protein
MVDTARTAFPPDMVRAAHRDELGTIESMACDLTDSLKRFVREKPEEAAFWALGIGFVLGWKLKPW